MMARTVNAPTIVAMDNKGRNLNATRHGVLSGHVVLPWEDPKEFQKLCTALADEHKPTGPTQEHIVEELAAVIWRKRRLWLVEQAAFGEAMENTEDVGRALTMQFCDPNKMQLVARYEAHLDRKLEKLLRLLL